MLALRRPPPARYRPASSVAPRLQTVLDAMTSCPALIRTATWDIVAWNEAAAAVHTNWSALPPSERNLLRRLFIHADVRAQNADWEGTARTVVRMFRGDTARAACGPLVQPLIEQLERDSPDFGRLWADTDVAGLDEGEKVTRHLVVGEIAMRHSSFAVDGRPDLVMLVHTPVGLEDEARIRLAMDARAEEQRTQNVVAPDGLYQRA